MEIGYAGSPTGRTVDHWSWHRRKQAARVRRTRSKVYLLEQRVDRIELALGAAIASVITGHKVTIPKTASKPKGVRQWTAEERKAMLGD